MNGPQQKPQEGVNIMPNQQESAPKWSREEFEVAKDLEVFIAQAPNLGNESYIEKVSRLANAFANAYCRKHSILGPLSINLYTDFPRGVRSAMSYLATEDKKNKNRQVLENKIKLASDTWAEGIHSAIERGDSRYLIENADPEELDDLLSHLPPPETR